MAEVKLPVDSQRRLIEIARQTLEHVVGRRPLDYTRPADPFLDRASYGAFVTLFNQDKLRGCIGTCTPSEPLGEMVAHMTEAAATRDRRMKPVCGAELEQICIDISVLSPLERSENPLSLEVGKHGLHIARDRKRGVLLPQVATEYGWDMVTFLEQTCLKANLPKDAWRRRKTSVSSFTALVIEEEK
jgi:uncharacterized protein